MNARPKPLKPGQTIGILGAGQLGRMLAVAAAQLGYRVHSFAPENQPPTAQLTNSHTAASFKDHIALQTFAQACDVITYEFENIPVSALEVIAELKPIYPGVNCLEIAQDRLLEKDFLTGIGVPCAPYQAVSTFAELQAAIDKISMPAVLKTRRFGYDGKGQSFIRTKDDVKEAWAALASAPGGLILEGFVAFEKEVSVLIARGQNGTANAYGPIWNEHSNHILHVSQVPPDIAPDCADRAISNALNVAEALNAIGVICVEFFVMPVGDVVANEIAPRVHNSGHWTIEGAVTSQFENHIRAITGQPLGNTDAIGAVRMQNLIGNEIDGIPNLLASAKAHVHHYGKPEARVGRKMGHVTWVTPQTKS